MFIRAYVGSQGKGSYKHEALISSGSYLLNDEKGNQEKAPISCCVFVSGDGGRAHNERCKKKHHKEDTFSGLETHFIYQMVFNCSEPPHPLREQTLRQNKPYDR